MADQPPTSQQTQSQIHGGEMDGVNVSVSRRLADVADQLASQDKVPDRRVMAKATKDLVSEVRDIEERLETTAEELRASLKSLNVADTRQGYKETQHAAECLKYKRYQDRLAGELSEALAERDALRAGMDELKAVIMRFTDRPSTVKE